MKQIPLSILQGQTKLPSICIVGAGLAGLTCALLLNKNGYQVTIIEKKQFPFHRVCGEYISNEVVPFLKSLQLDIGRLNPSSISRLTVSSVSGKSVDLPLQMGGFGVSRYALDHYLYQEARARGIEFIFAKVNDIAFADEQFTVRLSNGTTINCGLAIAAYGKRSNLDQKLNRKFFYQRSPYMGVKYHIKTDLAADLIRLDIFKGGYCGTCKIEGDLFNLCYLSETKNIKTYGSIPEMERALLSKNPHLKPIFENSDFISEKPDVINEISFEQKSLVEDHILFCGDAAGLITPLCGNGMAMAIHSGKILAECIIVVGTAINPSRRLALEKKYVKTWQNQFALRLKAGRYIQKLFLNLQLGNAAIGLLQKSSFISGLMVKSTHGKRF